jgi:hypothetical protein
VMISLFVITRTQVEPCPEQSPDQLNMEPGEGV